MNTEDLKQRMFDISTRENITDRKSLFVLMADAIDEFEQSNKIEDAKIKFEPEYYIHKEIECMKFEAEELRNKYVVSNNFLENTKKENQEMFNGLKTEIEALKKQNETLQKTFNKIYNGAEKPVEQEKQERFIFQSYDGSGKFHIYDNNQEYFHDGLFSRNQAEETCRILNEMEASK